MPRAVAVSSQVRRPRRSRHRAADPGAGGGGRGGSVPCLHPGQGSPDAQATRDRASTRRGDEAAEQGRGEGAEAAAEFRREGGPRDRGPERLLARNVVDSRRTVGTWFFGGALVVLIGSNQAMPPVIRLASNLLWGALALGVVVDSVLISRKIKKLVRERFPKSTQRMGSLYLYAIMRAITFRKLRTPEPRVAIGDQV
ncbi:DUF3043 domain-containing protein [Verrucosispora sioxanthis]|uniref:DUF3043 domain-containing protein n=1 Tax=Verrucosispora sioxanthis TaxID=2499994 RepID=UPI0035A01314